MLDGECLKSKKEVSDLKDQLAKDEHLIDELRQDNYNMKQKLVESEGQKEGAKREIQNLTRKLTETEEDNRVREKDFNAALDEAHRAEQKSADKVRKKNVQYTLSFRRNRRNFFRALGKHQSSEKTCHGSFFFMIEPSPALYALFVGEKFRESA